MQGKEGSHLKHQAKGSLPVVVCPKSVLHKKLCHLISTRLESLSQPEMTDLFQIDEATHLAAEKIKNYGNGLHGFMF